MQRCREGVILVGTFRKREIHSIVQLMSEEERQALNDMVLNIHSIGLVRMALCLQIFSRLLFAGKLESPITPFIRSFMDHLKMDTSEYNQSMDFFKHHASTYWSEKDINGYEVC